MRNRRLWLGILIGVIGIFGLGLIGFFDWTGNSQPATIEALASLESDAGVEVITEPWIAFMPQDQQSSVGFIFYPGGLIEAEAYAPTVRPIAEAGYLTIITPMPLNLAVLNSGAAADVMGAYPEIENWVIGGHSLGGSMAASYADKNTAIDGLALWASYPAESTDLSNQSIAVTSIYGTLDGLAAPEKVLAGKPRLPDDTIWVPIEGGNHAQFGSYGPQEGDKPAIISREEQQAQVVEATLELLVSIGEQ